MDRLNHLYYEQGESPWLDNLKRSYLTDGTLRTLVAHGVRGLTSNPTIFQKAIQGSADYDEQQRALVHSGASVIEQYWAMVLADINGALDEFAQLHHDSFGGDGYVSVEVAPSLAHDGPGTEAAARALHEQIDRPNLMAHVASVASFFDGRVDSEVDARLDAIGTPEALALRGKAAIAQAKLAYHAFRHTFSGARWEALAADGAVVQRPLWASTSTKNPAYPDTLYVDELIGPDTVNTLPDATIEAFAHHGTSARTIDEGVSHAELVWRQLAEVGVDMDDVADKLERDGVASFQKSFDDLLEALAAKADELRN